MTHALPHRFGEIVAITPANDVLGECPVWSAEENALYWIDVRAPAIRRLDPATGAHVDWTVPELIGSMALRPGGGIVVGLRSGIAMFDPASGSVTRVAPLHEPGSPMRLNDGKCDRQGRFWVGSMDDVGRGPVGILYRLDGRGCVKVAGDVAVPNSLCWSPDGAVMYFADGVDPVIWAYPLDVHTGALGERRVFARLPAGTGIPDGATVDDAGHVWSANYGGSCITRYTPGGVVAEVLPLPVSQPTSCAFGGPDLDILFITTASQRLTPEQRMKEPLAGAVLAVRVRARGLPEPQFAG
jgi:sugar lactone lactonase YvrE